MQTRVDVQPLGTKNTGENHGHRSIAATHITDRSEPVEEPD
jgi:hypothetical protein